MGDRLGIHGAVDIFFFLISNILGLKKWLPDCSLAWVALGQRWSLSKTTRLILLDSLLQEVCIRSGLAGRSPVSSLRWVPVLFSYKPPLFRTNDSPLDLLYILFLSLHSIYNSPRLSVTARCEDTHYKLWHLPRLLGPRLQTGLGLMPQSECLSKTTKLIIAWFTSTRGVYRVWPTQSSYSFIQD